MRAPEPRASAALHLSRAPFLVLAALLLGWLGAVDAGAQPLEEHGLEGALLSLEVQQELDRRLLRNDRERYRELLRRRRETTKSLDELYGQLDALYERLVRGDVNSSEAIQVQREMAELESRVQQAEQENERVRREAWLLRDRMRERGVRLALLGARLQGLEATSTSVRGPLTGRWRVTVLPMNMEGVFSLRQSGTLVSGRYALGTERRGSFTGTVVGNRVTLQEVDARYGRDAVYYGELQEDGDRIEGTWESLSLGTGRPSFGIWRAERLPEEGTSGETFPDDATEIDDEALPEERAPVPTPRSE